MLKIKKQDCPIGIFDSGVGGLTVAKAVIEQLPRESIIYFGDTANLPYGDKSIEVIQGYAKKIVDFLLQHKVKLILIACNSASAAAYEMLQSYVASDVLLVNVVDPVTKFLSENYAGRRVGLIGTRLTVQSGIYQQRLAELVAQIDLCALATPLLAPIIEERFFEQDAIAAILSEYLADATLQDIEALVLGCTHYPVIKKHIAAFYHDKNKIDIIDASKIIASEVEKILASHDLLSAVAPQHRFCVSDYTAGFVQRAQLFFGEEVEVESIINF